MFLEAQRCAGPVNGRSANRLHDPGGKACEVFGDAPVARCRAFVEPSKLTEAWPLVVDEVFDCVACARFENDGINAEYRKFRPNSSAAGSRADDYYNRTVVLFIGCRHGHSSRNLVILLVKLLEPIDIVEPALDVAAL